MIDLPFIADIATDTTVIDGTTAFHSAAFGDLSADDHKAYCEFEICSTLPNVHGPEKHGRYFGWHPEVMANYHNTLLYAQTNIGHTLRRYGGNADRINGCIIGVSYPQRPYAGWKIEKGAEASAPRLRVLAVIHKDASGVPEWIGQHLGGRQKNSVSIEADSAVLEVYDPLDHSIVSMQEAQSRYPKAIRLDKKNGWQVGSFEGRQLAFVPGGTTGPISLHGVGYVGRAAESTARITRFAAELEDEGAWNTIMASHSMSAGMSVSWVRISSMDAGKGIIKEVIDSGAHSAHGIKLIASMYDPLLRISIKGKPYDIIRPASRVKLLDTV